WVLVVGGRLCDGVVICRAATRGGPTESAAAVTSPVEINGEAKDERLEEVEQSGEIANVDGRTALAGASCQERHLLHLAPVQRILHGLADLNDPLGSSNLVPLQDSQERGDALPLLRLRGVV